MAQPSSFYISKGSMHVLSFEVWYKISDRTQLMLTLDILFYMFMDASWLN